MNVLVDTSIWSLALRRKKGPGNKKEELILQELKRLIEESRALIIGPIRQEVLSGISSQYQFEALQEKLKAFEDLPVYSSDYELAAEFHNQCRRNGIQGSHIDFLICAVAKSNDIAIFIDDKDFLNYSNVLNLELHCDHEK